MSDFVVKALTTSDRASLRCSVYLEVLVVLVQRPAGGVAGAPGPRLGPHHLGGVEDSMGK